MKNTPAALMIVAALCFSINAITIKFLSESLHTSSILFFRFLIVSLLFPIAVFFFSHHSIRSFFSITKIQLARIFLLSFFVVSNMYLFFLSYGYISVNRSLFLFLTYPIFTLILAHLFTNEPITKNDLLATALSFLGVALIFSKSTNLGDSSLFGDFLVICSAFLWSCYLLLNRYTAARDLYWRQTFWMFIFITLLFFPIYLLFGREDSIIDLPIRSIALLSISAIISTIIPYAIINRVTKELKTSTIGLILLVGQMVSIMLSYLLLKEPLSFFVLMGGFLIISAAALSIYSLEHLFSLQIYLRLAKNAGSRIGNFKAIKLLFWKK